MSRRDIRALENRMRESRFAPPLPKPARTAPKRASIGRQTATGVAMAMIALFTVSASLPALAVSPQAPQASAPSSADSAGEQILRFSSTASAPIQRDGFTVTDVPKPASYTELAANGRWASLDESQLSDLGWALPVLGRVTSRFGPRPNRPVAGVGGYHKGTDIAAPCGQPVFAATGGTVVQSGYQGSYGKWLLIDHGDGIKSGYAHNSTLLVNAGQTVTAGEVIALVGTTGSSSGCHVHFETRVDGTHLNPQTFMSSRGVSLD
ncbi:M23 family metallopeptidase [Cryobacterium psychrophilum]|nr:M23 family metallopeptidase [Cryobacterium psychrophilum]